MQLERFEQGAVGERLAPLHRHRVAHDRDLAVAAFVGVAQIADQLAAVVGGRGAEQQRELAVQPQLEAIEEARAAVEQAIGFATGDGHVAGIVEDREAVVVIEQQTAAAGGER